MLWGALERIDAVGLQATFTPGHYAAFNYMANSTFGGSASFGGVTTQPQRTGASLLSAPELGWIKKQLEARNLTHVVGAMFLHDVVRYRFDSEDYLKIVLTQVKTSERPARHLKDAKDTKIAFQELSWVDSILKSWAELLDVSCVSNDIISGQTEVDFEKWRWCFR